MNGTRGLCTIILVVALCFAGCRAPSASSNSDASIGVNIGDRGPPVRGTLANGDAFRLATGRGAITVLVFYRSGDCGLCRVQLEQIQRNLIAYQRQGARVVAVTLDPPAATQRLGEQLRLEFDIVSVDERTFTEWGALAASGATILPATFLLDESGVIRYRHVGRTAADRAFDAEILSAIEVLWGE